MAKAPLTKDDREHLRWAREFENLHLHPGWKLYVHLLNEHIKQKEEECMKPAGSVDEAMRQNAAKGAVLMGRLARDITSGIIAVARDLRNTKLEENEVA